MRGQKICPPFKLIINTPQSLYDIIVGSETDYYSVDEADELDIQDEKRVGRLQDTTEVVQRKAEEVSLNLLLKTSLEFLYSITVTSTAGPDLRVFLTSLYLRTHKREFERENKAQKK